MQLPAVVTVIDHQFSHSAVYADILSGNKAGIVGSEKQHGIRYIQRIAYSANRLLICIRTGICSE